MCIREQMSDKSYIKLAQDCQCFVYKQKMNILANLDSKLKFRYFCRENIAIFY